MQHHFLMQVVQYHHQYQKCLHYCLKYWNGYQQVHKSMLRSIHPSIHLGSTAYTGLGCGGSSFSRGPQTSLSMATTASSDWEIPRHSHPEQTHFSRLCPRSHSVGHDPSFMTICERKVRAKPLPLHQFSDFSPAPSSPHLWPKPTWTPSLGVRTHSLLRVDSQLVSCWEPDVEVLRKIQYHLI